MKQQSAKGPTAWSIIAPRLRRYRRGLLLAALATTCFNLLSVMPPLVIRFLVDHVVQPERWDRLYGVIAIYALAPILAQVIQFVNARTIVWIGQRVIADIRISMYRLILRLSMRFHTEQTTGSLVGRLMEDVITLEQLVSARSLQLFGDVIVFGFSLAVAFTISVRLGLILLGVVLLYVGAYIVFSRRIRSATHSMRDVRDLTMGRLQETLLGVRHVRIYSREDYERDTFLDRTGTQLQHAFSLGLSSVGLSVTCNVIAGYGSTLVYGLAAVFVLRNTMTLGDLIALNTYVWMSLQPAIRLTAFAGQLADVQVALQRIAGLLGEVPDIRSEPAAPVIRHARGEVEFRNVTFSYRPDQPLFRDLNLHVPPDTHLALVGPTGCGKTTMTALMMRLWDVQGGAILVDGTDIRSVNLKSLRNLFGVVLQESIMFEGTVAENIAFGRPGAPRADIEAAAEAAEVLPFASQLPDGLDTILGTQGVQLSLGQKQCIGIARAILRDPPILILDEATSALDSESEAAIQRAIAAGIRGRTSFVIAHRLSTITGADRIVVLDQGRIVEQGRHDDLVQRTGGAYRNLYETLNQPGAST